MKRLAIAAIGFTVLAFPAVLLAAVFSFGCCVVPCHAMQSPTIPMCSAAPTQTVVHAAPQLESVEVGPTFHAALSPRHTVFECSITVDRDVGLYILLNTLII